MPKRVFFESENVLKMSPDNTKQAFQQVDKEKYNISSYNTKQRFASYWYQIDEIIKKTPTRILEVGIGNKFVSNYLRKQNIDVTTFDIDFLLCPNVSGSVHELPFKNSSFDLVACFEILEHLPFENFAKAISEVFRVSKHKAILSLPDVERCYQLNIGGNSTWMLHKYIEIPRKKKPVLKWQGEHYWEIGREGYPLGKICSVINECDFQIERTYRIFEHLYHRMFILNKNNSRESTNNKKNQYSKLRLGNLEPWRELVYEQNLDIKTILKQLSVLGRVCR